MSHFSVCLKLFYEGLMKVLWHYSEHCWISNRNISFWEKKKKMHQIAPLKILNCEDLNSYCMYKVKVYCKLWINFTHCSCVFLFDFEEVDVGLVYDMLNVMLKVFKEYSTERRQLKVERRRYNDDWQYSGVFTVNFQCLVGWV